MTGLDELYPILEEMLKSAEKGKSARVAQLNRRYDALALEVYGRRTPTALEANYDSCRQSCVMAVKNMFELKEQFLHDARERF